MLFAATAIPIKAINHLLAEESWARLKLQTHHGKTVACRLSSETPKNLSNKNSASDTANNLQPHFKLRITADGLVEISHEVPAVTLRIKLTDLPALTRQRERALSFVRIEGDAEFAQAIGYVAQHLRWDATHDLSKIIGNVLALRVTQGASSMLEKFKTLHRKTTENIAEYLLEENPMLVRHGAVNDYASAISILRDDIERLSKRIQRLI